MIAIFEGRGIAREVGMAALDKETGRVVLVQVRKLKACCNEKLTFIPPDL